MADEAPVRLKPLFLIKPKTMSQRDIKRIEKLAGICVVELVDPEDARFLEAPIDAEIDMQARAALSLMRYVVRATESVTTTFYGSNLIKFFVDQMLAGQRPESVSRVKEVRGKGK